MKIRPLLIGILALAFAVVASRLFMLALNEKAQAKLDIQREAVEVIARDAAGLLVLMQDFVLHDENQRALTQWFATHRSMSKALGLYASTGTEYKQEISELNDSVGSLVAMQNELKRAIDSVSNPDNIRRKETLQDQLLNVTREISESAFNLSNAVTVRRGILNVSQRTQAVVAQAALLLIIGVMAAIIWYRLLRPMSILQNRAQRLANNELGILTGYSRKDELGELAHAFDHMSTTLLQQKTSLKATANELTQSMGLLREVIKALPFGVAVFDEHQMAMMHNHGFITLMELECLNNSCDTFALKDVFEVSYDRGDFGEASRSDAWNEVQAKVYADSTQSSIKSIAGGKQLQFSSTPLSRGWVLCTFVDITEIMNVNKALQDAKNTADKANRAKSDFLANMSHEIRTPLNSIIGMAYMLDFTHLDADQKSQLETIHIASHSLLCLINDILDLSKIEAGEFELEILPFSIKYLLDDIGSILEPFAVQKNIKLEIHPPEPDLPPMLEGDSHRIRQMLVNLLNNAIKFTEYGHVKVDVSLVRNAAALVDGDVENNANYKEPLIVRFAVTDTGIGISEEQQKKLFSPFSQVDSSTARKYGGSGLGLSIVKMMADKMGGACGIESVEGVGSTFWFELPLKASSSRAQFSDEFQELRVFNVLIAEKSSRETESLLAITQHYGWASQTVPEGQNLLDCVSELVHCGRVIDCIIIGDLKNDLTVAQIIQGLQQAYGSAGLPYLVIATEESSVLETNQLPATPLIHLKKPVCSSELFNAINQAVIGQNREFDHLLNSSRLDVYNNVWLSGIHLLVIDDSAMNLEVCRRILENEGAQVTLCQSGRDALEKLTDHSDVYDLILMDMQMPEMDGKETTVRIRQNLGLKSLPIVALTAGVLTEDRDKAMAAGVNAFLGKPIDPQQIVRVVRRWVESYRTKLLPVLPRTDTTPLPVTKESNNDSWPNILSIETSLAKAQSQGDVALFHEILRLFLKDYCDGVGQLQELLDKGSTEPALAYLHKLRGQLGCLGAQSLRVACLDLEQAWRRNTSGSTHQLSNQLSQFAAGLSSLIASINTVSAPTEVENASAASWGRKDGS